jgi:hypothetical protein
MKPDPFRIEPNDTLQTLLERWYRILQTLPPQRSFEIKHPQRERIIDEEEKEACGGRR